LVPFSFGCWGKEREREKERERRGEERRVALEMKNERGRLRSRLHLVEI